MKEIEIPEGCEAKIVGNKVVFVPKESEDERIRERLVEYFKGFYDRFSSRNNVNVRWERLDVRAVIAYLERQKEYIEDIRQYAYNKGLVDAEEKQKPAEWSEDGKTNGWTGVDLERYLSCLQRLGTGDPQQPETINSKWFKEHCHPQRRQEWSEEDKKMLDNTLDSLRRYQLSMPNFQVELQMRWLKSLRPQLKKEWSMEDAVAMKDIQMIISVSGRSEKNKRDLRAWVTEHCNAFPLPHWKPSKEQLDALDNVASAFSPKNKEYKTVMKYVNTLRDDLKKL